MIDEGLLDLESRKGKAPGGYQEFFNESRTGTRVMVRP